VQSLSPLPPHPTQVLELDISDDFSELCALHGYKDLLRWGLENLVSFSWDAYTCSNAAKNGNLELLKWARAQGCPWNGTTLLHACAEGHLEVVQWALDNHCDCDFATALHVMAKHGHFHVLDYFYEKKFWTVKDVEDIFFWGIFGGQTKMYAYLRGKVDSEYLHPAWEIIETDISTFRNYTGDFPRGFFPVVCLSGRLDILEDAENRKLDRTEVHSFSLFQNAVIGGRLDVIKWLVERDSSFNAENIWEIGGKPALFGLLEVLKYAVDEFACDWPKEVTCLCAALSGQLEVLTWAVARGLPVDHKNILWCAAMNVMQLSVSVFEDKLKVLRWAKKEGFPFFQDLAELVGLAWDLPDLKMYRWLLRQGGKV